MKTIKATKCARCPRTFDDSTGGEIHPELANPVGFCICPACIEAANAKVKAERDAVRLRALEELAGRTA